MAKLYDTDELEQYKADLFSDIINGHYEHVIEIIIDMTTIENDLGNISRITRSLNNHKSGIMHEIVKWMHFIGTKWIIIAVPVLLKGFERFNIDWPDLKIIQKFTDNLIKERDAKLAQDPENTNITENSDDAKRTAEYYKRQIATSVIEDDMIRAFELLSDFGWTHRDDIGDIRELNTILNRNKQRIIASILDDMLKSTDDDICYSMPQVIDGLKNAGIHWPDLKHINTTVDNIQGDLYEYQQPVNNIVHRNRKT